MQRLVRRALQLALVALLGATSSSAPSPRPARLVLWAWERPERLGFIDPSIEVAFLAETLALAADGVEQLPRRQPLLVPSGTRLTAVVRIESRHWPRPKLGDDQRLAAVEALVAVQQRTHVDALQIDFDATVRERVFYAALLSELRARLPRGVRLSITALASWCLDDPWIGGLPVDEAVPMLFRMGPEGRGILRRLAGGEAFRVPLCRGSIGVSTDEEAGWVRAASTSWVFHPRAWDAASVAAVEARVGVR